VVTVVRPVSYPVQSYYHYNGWLDAVESVRITARVKGFLNEIRFTEGDIVNQGDLLFKIDPREYQVAIKKGEADRLKAAAEVKKAKADEDRARQLIASRAISEEEFQQRVAIRETAEAVLKQAEAAIEAAKIELDYTEIKAPISGQISRIMVTRGNLVGQNEPTLLTTIVSVDPVYVYFDLPERDLVEHQLLASGSPQPSPTSRTIPVEVGIETEQGYPHAGKIDFLENRVETSTGTVRMRGRIPNPVVSPGNIRVLYPGLFARVRIPAGGPKTRLILPEDALLTGQEGRFVYVLGPDNVVQKRTVTVGPAVWKAPATPNGTPAAWALVKTKAGEKDQRVPLASAVAIEGGLEASDRVIVNGLTKARPGAPVAPDEWTLVVPPPPAAPAGPK
jgi:multidrug efflux system membrane fusion protein